VLLPAVWPPHIAPRLTRFGVTGESPHEPTNGSPHTLSGSHKGRSDSAGSIGSRRQHGAAQPVAGDQGDLELEPVLVERTPALLDRPVDAVLGARRVRGCVRGVAADPQEGEEYRVIDAAVGVVERGTWRVEDAVEAMPWLPNGPIPLDVTWTRPGYARGQQRESQHREGQTA